MILRCPAWATLEPPSGEHWLGNDGLGRDLFSRLVYGARISLRIGVISIGIGITFGVPLGNRVGLLQPLGGHDRPACH